MKVNWKVRFKNKTWLSMFLSLIIGFVYYEVPTNVQGTIMSLTKGVLLRSSSQVAVK